MAANKPPPCCPSEAEPLLIMSDYEPRGQMVTLGSLPVYVAFPSGPVTRGVVMFTDMFGVQTGRHKQFCDNMAERGILAACPDFFAANPYLRGAPKYGTTVCCFATIACKVLCGLFDKTTKMHSWDVSLRQKVVEVLLPFMREKGVREFASIGFCWGSYGAMKCAALPEFRCSAAFHPSVDGFCKATGEDDLKICREIKCPTIVVSTKNEKPAWQPGGAAQLACEEGAPGKATFRLQEGMKHGYMTRADVTKDAAALEAVRRGMDEFLQLVDTNMA